MKNRSGRTFLVDFFDGVFSSHVSAVQDVADVEIEHLDGRFLLLLGVGSLFRLLNAAGNDLVGIYTLAELDGLLVLGFFVRGDLRVRFLVRYGLDPEPQKAIQLELFCQDADGLHIA